MVDDFTAAVGRLVRRAPAGWMEVACAILRGLPATASAEFVLQRMPTTTNSDLAFLMSGVVRAAAGQMSWEALGWALQTALATFHACRTEQQIELLWSGPSSANQIAARRIDQALYDLIAVARSEILLVTFAAAQINRLTEVLWKAVQRGVKIRLILEFKQSSEGQLSYDALKAFPPLLIDAAEVYHWPVERRERNNAGRPGKLHAKMAIVDEVVMVSSANLTDDAFNRNLEVGVMITSAEFRRAIKVYWQALISDQTLQLIDC
jgi:cardiolipin synthase